MRLAKSSCEGVTNGTQEVDRPHWHDGHFDRPAARSLQWGSTSTDAGESSTAAGGSSTDAKADVSVTSCTVSALESVDVDTESEETEQVPTATVEVKNPTGATANYEITVEFKSKDGSQTFEAGDGAVTGVPAGQSKTGTVQSTDSAEGGVTCTVTEALSAGGPAARGGTSGPRREPNPLHATCSLRFLLVQDTYPDACAMFLHALPRIAARPRIPAGPGDGVRQVWDGVRRRTRCSGESTTYPSLRGWWLLVCVRLPDGCDLKVVLSARRNCGPEGPRGGDRPPLSSASVIG